MCIVIDDDMRNCSKIRLATWFPEVYWHNCFAWSQLMIVSCRNMFESVNRINRIDLFHWFWLLCDDCLGSAWTRCFVSCVCCSQLLWFIYFLKARQFVQQLTGDKPKQNQKKYFTSNDPHHDIYTFSYWQIFWHSIWHIFWHIFWHSIWHIFWHSIWHFIWHIFWHFLSPLGVQLRVQHQVFIPNT